MATPQQVIQAKTRREDAFLSLDGVVGVGVAYKVVSGQRTSELAIQVMVTDKRDVPDDQLVPPTIDGVKTDVVERHIRPIPVIPVTTALTDASRYDPLVGGISISPCADEVGASWVGTLGMIVEDIRTGEHLALSNAHVFKAELGTSVTQPSSGDGGVCPDDVIGSVVRGDGQKVVDGAVATIISRDHDCRIEEIGAVSASTPPVLESHVMKRGRTSGLTEGWINAVNVTLTPEGGFPIRNQIEVRAQRDAAFPEIDNGWFIQGLWNQATTVTSGDVVVTRDPEAGVTVSGPDGSLFLQTPQGHVVRVLVFGSAPYVLVRDASSGPGPVTYSVIIVNLTTSPPTSKLLLSVTVPNAQTPDPKVYYSPGSGRAFMAYASGANSVLGLGIYNSSNGETLCLGPPGLNPTGEIKAEARNGAYIIHYSMGGQSFDATCGGAIDPTVDGFLLPGDSGSILVDDSHRLIGLLHSSTSERTDSEGNATMPEGAFAYASPIDAVFSELEVKRCGGSGSGSVGVPPGSTGGRRRDVSLRNAAEDCLGLRTPYTVLDDVMRDGPLPHSLRSRLLAILNNC